MKSELWLRSKAILRHPSDKTKRKKFREKLRQRANSAIFEYEATLQGEQSWRAFAKTILLCSHSVGQQIFGGERSFVDLARALGSEFNVVVTLQNGFNEAYVQAIKAHVQQIRIFPYHRWEKTADLELPALNRFIALIDEIRPDLVYANTITLNVPLVAAKLRSVPSIVHAREIITHDAALAANIGRDPASIVAQVIRSCDSIIANSVATSTCFAKAKNIAILPNTIDSEIFDIPNTLAADIVRFGLISSNVPKKGIDDFIKLAELCAPSVPKALFVIIGPLSASRLQFHKESGTLAGLNNVELVDYQQSSVDALKKINVVVNFSHFQESFGRTILEGMAASRPAIAFDWGALPELIEDDKTGFLVPFRKPEDAVRLVAELCARPERLIEMGAAAQKRAVDKYGIAAFRRDAIDICRKAMAQNAGHAAASARSGASRIQHQSGKSVDIIVCVHNALSDVQKCLDSVLKRLRKNHRVIVVDDGSAEETREYLRQIQKAVPNVTLLRNDVALGYTRAANMGLRKAKADLVVLLNSDTIVTDHWLEKLADAVVSVHGAGIVGPMSNAASFQSLPNVNSSARQTAINGLPPGISIDQMNGYCEDWSSAVPCVPLVHGFCLGLTREAIQIVGEFDEQAFPSGYGEENDYCFRAVNNGVWPVIATNTFVYHAKTKSYSEQKRYSLSESAQQVLYERYGKSRFDGAVRLLRQNPELRRLRNKAAELFPKGT